MSYQRARSVDHVRACNAAVPCPSNALKSCRVSCFGGLESGTIPKNADHHHVVHIVGAISEVSGKMFLFAEFLLIIGKNITIQEGCYHSGCCGCYSGQLVTLRKYLHSHRRTELYATGCYYTFPLELTPVPCATGFVVQIQW